MDHVANFEKVWGQVKADIDKLETEKKEWEELKKQEREAFEKEKENWAVVEKKLNKSQIEQRIKLDIGGSLHTTSLGTLLSQQGSFFEAMFSGRWDTKSDQDGIYFIDRDPLMFNHLLNFLREGTLDIDLETLTQYEFKKLRKDAEYYQLDALIPVLDLHEINKPAKSARGIPWTLSMSNQCTGPPNIYEALISNDPRYGAGTTKTNNEWIQATFTEPVFVETIKLHSARGMTGGWDVRHLNGARLEYSLDGTNWTIATTVAGVKELELYSLPVGRKAKYWKFTKSGYFGIGILRFE
eukprot:TRINITY_DN1642_c0_g2_i1.p1 TRINITY_DN1642_c0_g2~~TRINITY_DN1642_c0_g2_i1.p1  ORF type:complete len:297 (+),score=50.54 TRINITY_DN1642_c0_g2_i1:441-1331(+)